MAEADSFLVPSPFAAWAPFRLIYVGRDLRTSRNADPTFAVRLGQSRMRRALHNHVAHGRKTLTERSSFGGGVTVADAPIFEGSEP